MFFFFFFFFFCLLPRRSISDHYLVTDEEIFQEMKKRYGKETLDVKEDNPGWFETVEEEARVKTIDELRKIKDRNVKMKTVTL